MTEPLNPSYLTKGVTPIPQSEVGIEQLALAAWNPFAMHDTSSRLAMLTGNLASCLVVANTTPQACSPLVNYAYKDYTFKTKFKNEGELVKLVSLYRGSSDRNNIKENPLETYIYYDVETNELSCLESQRHFRLGASSFGYELVKNEKVESEIYNSRRIPKGAVIGETPNIDEDGEYNIGIQTNVLMATLPGVVEDGFIMRRGYAEAHGFKMYSTYVIDCDSSHYPLNLYGEPGTDEYKIHPDIGEYVRDDGLLIALRRRDPVADITNQNPHKLREYCPYFDKLTFDYKGAKVVDVRVYSEHVTDPASGELITHRRMSVPEKMMAQTFKYIRGRKRYLKEIYDVYRQEKKRHPDLRLSDEMNTLVFEAIQEDTNWLTTSRPGAPPTREKITKAYHKVPLSDYRIEITVESIVIPNVQTKATGFDGDKGVSVILWEDEDMPVDGLGNVTDIIVDPTAVTKRTIAGRPIQAFIAGAMRDIRVRFAHKHNLPLGLETDTYMKWVDNNPLLVKETFDFLMEVRKDLTPAAYRAVIDPAYAAEVAKREAVRVETTAKPVFSLLGNSLPEARTYSVMEVEVLDFLCNGLNLEILPDSEVPHYTACEIIRDKYRPHYDVVKYRVEGKEFVSERPAMIGSIYQIILDKVGFDFSAVASGKTQHFGIPAKQTNNERRSRPVRQQPTRCQGEAEVENEIATAGSKFTYQLLEASNSPAAHRKICEQLMDAKEPTKLVKVMGSTNATDPISRPLEVVHHILECGGTTLIRDKISQ